MNIDELIQEIIIKNHIALGKDDPLIIGWTINELMIANNERMMTEDRKLFLEKLEEILQYIDKDSKERMERMSSTILSRHKEVFSTCIEQLTFETFNGLEKSFENFEKLAEKKLHYLYYSSLFNFMASVIIFLAMGLFVITFYL